MTREQLIAQAEYYEDLAASLTPSRLADVALQLAFECRSDAEAMLPEAEAVQ